MIRTYKYRLYPNKSQDARLDFLLWQGRKVYNGALAMRKDHYEATGETISAYDIRDYWCAQRKVEPDTLGQLPTKTITDLIFRLDKAYKAFFRRIKAGEDKAGFPRFKNRQSFNSLGFVPRKHALTPTSEGWAKLHLTSMDALRLRYHRPLPDGTAIKMLVVLRNKRGQWFVAMQCEVPDPVIEPNTLPAVGVDVGLVYALALSDGTVFECPKWYQDAQKQRRVLSRKIDRQRRANNPQNYNEDGTAKPNMVIWRKSTRQRQTEDQLRRLDDKVAQQRWYWWHTVTDWLTKHYSMIAIEDLTLDFMLKNKRLAMHAQNASFATFWQFLDYKASERGVEIVRVAPQYTSQTCSECGAVDSENRKTQANFTCVSCGHSENADLNAAKNILRAALKTPVLGV